jgi:hypothetical protein
MLKSFASGLHEEWSKPVDKCFGLLATVERDEKRVLYKQVTDVKFVLP